MRLNAIECAPMASKSNAADTTSFESALAELETIVQQLESGKISLDDSVAAYERGMMLRQLCETRLNEAQLKIQHVAVSGDGALQLTPLDPDTLTPER